MATDFKNANLRAHLSPLPFLLYVRITFSYSTTYCNVPSIKVIRETASFQCYTLVVKPLNAVSVKKYLYLQCRDAPFKTYPAKGNAFLIITSLLISSCDQNSLKF